MASIMALDYGTKRVGVAVTDELQLIASGLTTVHSKDLVQWLKNYFEKNEVETVVIGEPKRLNNTETDSTEAIENFVRHFVKVFPGIKLERMDERFTSKMAFQTMIDSGLSKKQRKNKALIDEISATIILQDYMERKANGFA